MTMSSPSVAVVGVGSTGAMAMWQLAKRGVRVTGFERFSPGHDRGAHGGETRIFRTAYQESPDYVPLLVRAKELWQQLEEETGAELLNLAGVLTIGAADTPQLTNVMASIAEYGLTAEQLSVEEARNRYPQHAVGDDESVVLDRNAGFLRPERAVLHASRRAEQLGATLHTYTKVTAIEPDQHGVTVRTDGGTERFDHVVVATGPWATQLLGGFGYDASVIQVRRIVQMWFPAKDPALFRPDRCPVFIRVSPVPYYGLPAADGAGLKLGVFTEENRVVTDPDDFDSRVGVGEIASFRDTVAELLPQLFPEPVRIGAFMEGYTPDSDGLIGALPGADNVTLLVGFSGHGFKLAPAFGALAADAVLGTRTTPSLPRLDPARELSTHPREVQRT
ncbi:MAG: N-methyl-L-tryptophan oxidase [Streptosporangiales bacterium]|nr:N-methyl-L-tryptophan oxidase [Streptosporangiales bacterium]